MKLYRSMNIHFLSLIFIIPIFSYKFTNTTCQILLSGILKCKKFIKIWISTSPTTAKIVFISYIFGDIFKERARVVTFDCGNDIFEEGDEPKGIYIIISGMVKVSQSYS